MAIKVKIIGLEKFKTISKDFLTILVNDQTEALAKETETVLERKIDESITRDFSTGNLVSNIGVEPIPNGHGVGNITNLNSNAPYWRHVNNGSEAIGASHSHTVPTGAFSGIPEPVANSGETGKWQVGGGEFSFKPTKPIAPRNFIEKTLLEIPIIISKILKRVK